MYRQQDTHWHCQNLFQWRHSYTFLLGLITNKMTSTGISRFSFQVQDQPTFKQLTLLVDYYREHDIGPCVSTEMQTYSGLYLDGVVGEGGREANTPLDNQPMSPIRIPFKVSVKTPLGMSWFCREGVDGLIVRRINPHSAIQGTLRMSGVRGLCCAVLYCEVTSCTYCGSDACIILCSNLIYWYVYILGAPSQSDVFDPFRVLCIPSFNVHLYSILCISSHFF